MRTTSRSNSVFHRLAMKGRPLVIAHRGASAQLPENTIPALVKAIEYGADVVEMDVHITKDNVVVVCHDPTVDRTTNGSGLIAEMTLSEIQKLDAGYRFSTDGGKTFPLRGTGITIPTLEEALRATGDHPAMIEVKVSTPEIVRQLVRVLSELAAFDRVSVEVFSMKRKAVRMLRRIAPNALTGHTALEIVRFMVLARLRLGRLFRRAGFAFEVPPRRGRTTVVTRTLIRAAQRRSIPVYVWTINEKGLMRQFLDMGVDGLFTDHTDVLRALVDSGQWDRNPRKAS